MSERTMRYDSYKLRRRRR